ncbi:META domain-containing protein [Bordetella genomosp. 13]|uniref:META domain-containing protein n=1 Tax=Bordetella genomosp. 13 TaxID=463040 RepID=UPI0011A2F9F9|nr:META domain-containing protein [Bordetella genomosp. 13]
MRPPLARLLPLVLPLALAACASQPPAGRAATYAAASQHDVLVQTTWELARWTRPGAPLRPVPHAGSNQQPITISFIREQGQPRLSGFSGCNTYSGQYVLANGLLVVTDAPVNSRMACPDAERARLEQDYLAALTRITASRLDSDVQPNRLTLVLDTGEVLDFGRRADPVAGGRM